MNIKDLLEQVKSGALSIEDATQKLESKSFADLSFAKVDLQRKSRQGIPEVVYGAGKTPEQIHAIVLSMIKAEQSQILITRLDENKADRLQGLLPSAHYDPISQIMRIGDPLPASGIGNILVLTAGTSDLPVAEEAAQTAEALGNPVSRIYDVGVAGLHRLLAHVDAIYSASVIIVVAGMEGALASVVGGLARCPVIAVPTSVGYGASLQGIAALLSMLNSCAAGVSVVNIDNGFGAAFMAHRINQLPLQFNQNGRSQ